MATFLVVSAPADELWHRIYGKDLTAWSLPHLSLAGGVTLITLVGASIALSLSPRQNSWSSVFEMDYGHWLAVGLLVVGTTVVLQVGTTEWEGLPGVLRETDAYRSAFWQRPVWLYPVVVVSITAFISEFALHAFRRWGIATLVALLVLSIRLAALLVMRREAERFGLGVTAHALLIAPALTLDLWYAWPRDRPNSNESLTVGLTLAGLAFLVVGLPLIDLWLRYPPVTAATIPSMISMSLVMALVAGWAGGRLGAWLGVLERPTNAAPRSLRAIWLSVGGVVLVLLLVVGVLSQGVGPAEATGVGAIPTRQTA